MTTITPTTTRNCYFHFDQYKPAVAIVNNGQFDMPVCLECLITAIGVGYSLIILTSQDENKELTTEAAS